MYLFQNLKLLWNKLLRSGSLFAPGYEEDKPEEAVKETALQENTLFEEQANYASELVRTVADEDAVKGLEDRIDLINTALTGFRSQWKERDSQIDTKLSVLDTRISETERKNNDYTEFNNRLAALCTRIDELESALGELPDKPDPEPVSPDSKEATTPIANLEIVDRKFRAYGDIYARLTAELKSEREMRIEQEKKIETILTVNRMLATKVAKLEGVSVPTGCYDLNGISDTVEESESDAQTDSQDDWK